MNSTMAQMLLEHITNFDTVKSSMITSLSFSPDYEYMIINFSSGDYYAYFDVTKDLYDKFVASESKGKFFNQFVKDKFESEKLINGVKVVEEQGIKK